MAMDDRLLGIYLNDHLAGSRFGVELVRRAASSNAGDPVFGEPLAQIRAEIETDRGTLEEVMRRNGIRRDPLKPAAAWTAEKLGRLKLNGRIRGYSPLSRVVELEGLVLGINGKLRLWVVLESLSGELDGDFDFGQLAARAAGQKDRIEELHLKAAALAFSR
jgi:hypothetical protein